MASLNENARLCVVCGNRDSGGGIRKIGAKGLNTLSDISKEKEDGVHSMLSSSEDHFIHDNCYKTYTRKTYIPKNSDCNEKREVPVLTLRSETKAYDYQTHCLICAEELDFDAARRNPERYSRISNVEIVSKDRTSIIQENLLKTCEIRNDAHSVNVKARILFAGDIRAVEAKYHQKCMQAFMSGKQLADWLHAPTMRNVRNLNQTNDEAFHRLCDWMTGNEDNLSQFSLPDLRSHMSRYLPHDVPTYSIKHLKRRLLERFRDEVTITQVSGTANIVTLACTATAILHDSYQEAATSNINDEEIRQAKAVGSNIRIDLLKVEQPTDVYPTPSDTDVDKLESSVPESLKHLIKAMFAESRTQSAKMKKKLVQTSICHVIMNAAGKQSFISPLLLSVGLFIHQTTRSRVLIDVLSSLGLCVSYDQVIAFERSAVVKDAVHSLPPGLLEKAKGGGFCQWVADNFDYNEDTISGYDSTHVMGVIACQTKTSSTPSPVEVIQRRNVSAEEIIQSGDFGAIIKPYKQPLKSLLADVMIKAVIQINLPPTQYELLDSLWLYSSLLTTNPPNWQGYMSEITKGTSGCHCTTVVYNPMIPLNPQTNEAVYSTMMFVQSQSKKAGMCCATLTFDQPLYLKSYQIKQDTYPEFSKMFLRLGGFHQLMSFLGAGCKLMEGSGLEDLWATTYARKSLPKMMEGKAYTKTLRACLLTDAALHLLLMGRANPEPGDGHDLDELQEDFGDPDEDPCSMAIESEQTQEMLTHDQENMDADDMWSELEPLYKSILAHDISLDEAVKNVHLRSLHNEVSALKMDQSQARTGKLWLMFMNFISVVRSFIRAERTGQWQLYLKSTQRMLPLFAAAGHNNYTKCCRLFLQDAQNLCPCLEGAMNDGLFTVRRNEQVFWSGTWSDMTIEQCLMRAGKTSGGLINITHKDSARTKWLLTSHILAQYTDALRSMTDTYTGTWSEQHREMRAANVKRDIQALGKFTAFLKDHSPFNLDEGGELRNIATGMIADHRVNVDNCLEIGQKIHDKLDNKRYGDITMKRSEQATTFAVMRKAIKVGDQEFRMSSDELYNRLLSTVCSTGPPDPSVFSYELAAVCPALFQDDCSMRKSQKSQLAKYILDMDKDILCQELEGPAVKVFDGCAMLHRIPWPKIGTLESACESFVSAVVLSRTQNVPIWVVFDSYDVATTKDQEQKRRRLQQGIFPDIVVKNNTPIPGNKTAFLSNRRNKQNFILLLEGYLEDAGVQVEHAGEEGDADVVIVRKALELSHAENPVTVIADDTDVLVLLLYHARNTAEIYLQTKKQFISIKIAREVLGKEMCLCLLFAHAVSGCDTTSAFYSIGKIKAMKVLRSSQVWRHEILVFGNNLSSKEEIKAVGEKFALTLYTGGAKVQTLDELRYLNIISSKHVSVERMPPTSRAMYFHSLRVHHQISTWCQLKTVLKKEEHGFRMEGGSVVPIITDKPPAPPELLLDIRCSCKKSQRLCSSCGCAKKGLTCSIHCKCEAQCLNSPTVTEIDMDENEEL